MDKVQRSAAWLRKRKMLTVLPLLIIPFLTMGFWAMGGGKGENGLQGAGSKSQGLNLNLPNANLKDDKLSDKLSFYDLAAKDSAKLAEEIQNDPNYQKENNDLFPGSPVNMIAEQTASKYKQSLNTSPYQSSQRKPEDEIMNKVAMLQEQLNKSRESRSQDARDTTPVKYSSDPSLATNVEKLEYMMQSMNNSDANDPQMNQMSSMLDKILDIQHPERVKEKIKEQSFRNKERVYPVCKLSTAASISLFNSSGKSNDQTGFLGMNDDPSKEDQNAVEAVVHQNQILVDGAVIKLRLLNDVFIEGNLVPKESFVFGICTLNGERLEVEINSIRCNNSLFPVKLVVYDMDGLPGIYIPGAITRDVAKQSADNSLQLMEMSSLDPSLKAQATATGINAVKNLLSKKTKLVKVMVKAGYKVLLKQKEN